MGWFSHQPVIICPDVLPFHWMSYHLGHALRVLRLLTPSEGGPTASEARERLELIGCRCDGCGFFEHSKKTLGIGDCTNPYTGNGMVIGVI